MLDLTRLEADIRNSSTTWAVFLKYSYHMRYSDQNSRPSYISYVYLLILLIRILFSEDSCWWY